MPYQLILVACLPMAVYYWLWLCYCLWQAVWQCVCMFVWHCCLPLPLQYVPNCRAILSHPIEIALNDNSVGCSPFFGVGSSCTRMPAAVGVVGVGCIFLRVKMQDLSSLWQLSNGNNWLKPLKPQPNIFIVKFNKQRSNLINVNLNNYTLMSWWTFDFFTPRFCLVCWRRKWFRQRK